METPQQSGPDGVESLEKTDAAAVEGNIIHPAEERGRDEETNQAAANDKAEGTAESEKGDPNDDDPWADTFFPDPDINDPDLVNVVSWWAEFTSIHGVYYAFERGHFRAWKQSLWMILVLVCSAFLIWVLVIEFQDYYQYTLNTSTANVFPPSLSFPEITVCNMNMYDTSLQNRTGIMEPSSESELNQIAQPFDEFIRYTSFNSIVYEDLNTAWRPVITPFGRCYSFITDEVVLKPGTLAGLEFYTWLNQSNYQASTNTAGIRIFVAQRGTTITDQAPQVLVPPGSASSVAMSLVKFKREKDEPWRKCKGSAPEYTNDACRAECIYAATRDTCNCRLIGDSEDPSMRYCNSSDDECSFAEEEALEECDCATPPCEEEAYVTRFSSAGLALKAVRQIEEQFEFPDERFEANLVFVNINYDAIRFEETTESKATSTAQLISNLGGNMGFFMGISMISIVELFVELFGLRMIPRLWGDKRLYGVGQAKTD